MGNCAGRLTSGRSKETIMPATGLSATPNVTSNLHTTVEECNLSSLDKVAPNNRSANLHTAVEDCNLSSLDEVAPDDRSANLHTALEECNLSSLDEVALGNPSSVGSSMEPKSEYFSARVEELMQSKSQFSSTVEHEIEHSRIHWSEVTGPSESSEDNNDNEEMNRVYYEKVDQENEEVFEELMNDPQWKNHSTHHFFSKCPPFLKLGRKIAEGGQAEIFEVIRIDDNHVYLEVLFKVFKRGSRLSNLKKQWPCGILRREVQCIVVQGIMLDDGRFAFGMNKCWGDLRKLIDQAMQEKNNQGSPFPYEWSGQTLDAKIIMSLIAHHMGLLHKQGIIHRDLKAANILLLMRNNELQIFVADFECSIGVVGTRFWRAPEILMALKNRSAIDFSEKVDVYSFGMTCFELITGRLPFEGELEMCRASHDLVIEGLRPKLPSDLDVTLKDLIVRCWNPSPNERPSFIEILEVLWM